MSEIPRGARPTRQPQGYTFWLIGEERHPLRDAYHTYLRMRWPASLALIAVALLAVNLLFAVLYYAVGGVGGMRTGSFFEAFVFSVQTLGTIGYGSMAPQSDAANAIMIAESITSVIVIALATGLVFSKFARATARVAFTQNAVITTHDGKPTLMFRCGNRRSNVIVEAQLRAIASITRTTAEGETFYKLHDLPLVRDRMTGMRRGWTVLHVIDERSPLYGMTNNGDLAKAEVELEISLLGFDDVTLQTVHAIHVYTDSQILFGRRFADTLRPLANGDMLVDLRNFDVTLSDDLPRDSVSPS
jgi:inward rectifier potassium channel